VNGTTYDANNLTGTEVFTNIGTYNCDSTVTVNLTIQAEIDNSTTVSNGTITANQANASYQWVDCDDNNSIVDGETSQSYTPTTGGNYAAVLTVEDCSTSTDCVNITILGFKSEAVFKDVSIYPVPNKGSVNIELGTLNHVTVNVFNTSGQLVYQQANINSSNVQFDINEEPGLYFIEVQSNDKKQTYKLIVE